MDKKEDKIQTSMRIKSMARSVKWTGKKIDYVEEDGVYKATIGKQAWYIPSKDRMQCIWALDFIKSHERYLHILKEGDTVIEVGAASGEYTIPVAKIIGEKGQIHAFEVEPAGFLCLEKNLALHNISNVKPVNKAVSDESNKTLDLSFEKGTLSGSTFHDDLTEKLSVKTITIDDYVSSMGIEKVDVLKATVNGHEPAVMKGAKNILKNTRFVTFQSAKYQEVISILSKEGFSVRKIADSFTQEVKIVLMEKS